MSLDTPRLFEPQLRAILRAAANGNIKVMFPMVADVEELEAAKSMLQECRKQLEAEGTETGEVETGVMIRDPGGRDLRRRARKGVSFLLDWNERPRPVHPGRGQGQRATTPAPERGPSRGSGPDPADLRGLRRGGNPSGCMRRGSRRARDDP